MEVYPFTHPENRSANSMSQASDTSNGYFQPATFQDIVRAFIYCFAICKSKFDNY